MKIRVILLSIFMIALGPFAVHAVERCKVNVDRDTGVIQVSAAKITGVLTWGDLPGTATNLFFNDSTCVSDGTAKGCELGASGSLQQILPPGRCLIFLEDDLTTCAAGIANCTPERTPPGTVVPFVGPSSAVPLGWLLADGSQVSRAVFADLFATIGSSHGDGDGVNTFHLPDYRGRFVRGVDAGSTRDPDRLLRTEMNLGGNTGDTVGSIQNDATAVPSNPFSLSSQGSHNHPINSAGSHSHFMGDLVVRSPNEDGDANGTPRWAAQRNNLFTGSSGNHGHSMNSAGSHDHGVFGGDLETRPQNAYVNWIIKY